MTAFKIEKNIPIPSFDFSSKLYPFPEMQVGDSIFVEASIQDATRAAAYYWAKKNKRKFITRRVDGGVRIWRVE